MSSFQIDYDCDDDRTEAQIVWLKNPLRFTYLRESTHWTTKPRGRIAPSLAEMAFIVGYAEYYPAGYRTAYARRFWWLKWHDRDLDHNGVYRYGLGPSEAVIPGSIEINQPSKHWSPSIKEMLARRQEVETPEE